MRSAMAWHGWWVSESPFTTGTSAAPASSSRSPWSKVRTMMASMYRARTRPVSEGVSRLPIWISSGLKWSAWPPSWYIYLEGDAGPVGWLLEDHRERTPAQGPVGDATLLQRLYAYGLVQDQGHFLWDELSECQAVATR